MFGDFGLVLAHRVGKLLLDVRHNGVAVKVREGQVITFEKGD